LRIFEKVPRNFAYLSVVLCIFGTLLGCSGGPDVNVSTQHNDKARTGAYLAETTLTPDKVRARGMREQWWANSCGYSGTPPSAQAPPPVPGVCIAGIINTQPLYVENVPFETGRASVVFVATANNMVYALDANTGNKIWEYELKGNGVSLGQFSRGVNSTPVIDVPNNRMYVLFSTKNQFPEWPQCFSSKDPISADDARNVATLDVAYWLAVLDIRDPNPDGKHNVIRITASVKRPDGTALNFVGKNQYDRPGLLLDRDSVYPHCRISAQ